MPSKGNVMKHRDELLWALSQCAVAFFLFCTISTAPAQTILPAEDIAEKALAATVYLEMKDRNGKALGIGSGFFVKSNLIATNYHVIEGAAKGTAKLVGKYTQYNIEGVTATDKANDLALLKVTVYGIKPLSLGDSDTVRIGETVYVAGNPKGLEGTFSDGLISSRRDRYTKERLQMTAPISPGSSGGPVLNRKVEVIGLSVSVHQDLDAQNLNFAIPANYLEQLIEMSGVAKPLAQDNYTISAETYFLWGFVRHEMGDYNGAISNYTQAIYLKMNSAGVYALRGLAKQELEQFSAAISDYDKAIQLNPDYAEAYCNRGLTKYRLGQFSAAITDYDKAIRLKPNYAEAYSNRGIALGNLGQNLAAVVDFDKAITQKPEHAEAYLGRGFAKTMLGQLSDAITDFNKALQLKPDYAEVYNARAFAKINQKQQVGAITDCNKAIQLKPNFAEAYITRGLAKGQIGRTFESMQDLKTALKLAENAGNVNLKSKIEKIIQLLK